MNFSTNIRLNITKECWPLAEAFNISRGGRTEITVIVVELSDGKHFGRGECIPYSRYGETAEGVIATIENLRHKLANGLDRKNLQNALPAGAARNALDCAFWDLEAKQSGIPVHKLADISSPNPLATFYTISLDTPEKMANAAARAEKLFNRLKIKLGADGIRERLEAVRKAISKNTMIAADINEAWNPENLRENLSICEQVKLMFVEQPLPASNDEALRNLPRSIPIYADESIHDRMTLPSLASKYDGINIKLDKTGGLTEALALAKEAKAMGFSIMVGCMVCTSLSIAPAVLVAQKANIVDLDGPLLLIRDRPNALHYKNGRVCLPEPALWG